MTSIGNGTLEYYYFEGEGIEFGSCSSFMEFHASIRSIFRLRHKPFKKLITMIDV